MGGGGGGWNAWSTLFVHAHNVKDVFTLGSALLVTSMQVCMCMLLEGVCGLQTAMATWNNRVFRLYQTLPTNRASYETESEPQSMRRWASHIFTNASCGSGMEQQCVAGVPPAHGTMEHLHGQPSLMLRASMQLYSLRDLQLGCSSTSLPQVAIATSSPGQAPGS